MENKKYNSPVLFAGLMTALTFLVHVFVGGPELYAPLRASALSIVSLSTWSVVWHFVSVQLLLLAAALFYLTRNRNAGLFNFVLATTIGFALLFIGYGIIDLRSVLLMPQWIAFVVVAGLMLWGRRLS